MQMRREQRAAPAHLDRVVGQLAAAALLARPAVARAVPAVAPQRSRARRQVDQVGGRPGAQGSTRRRRRVALAPAAAEDLAPRLAPPVLRGGCGAPIVLALALALALAAEVPAAALRLRHRPGCGSRYPCFQAAGVHALEAVRELEHSRPVLGGEGGGFARGEVSEGVRVRGVFFFVLVARRRF